MVGLAVVAVASILGLTGCSGQPPKPSLKANIINPKDRASFTAGTTIQFEGIALDAENKEVTKDVVYEWDFGDGEKATTQSATHEYKESKDYTVTFSVKTVPQAKDATAKLDEKQTEKIVITVKLSEPPTSRNITSEVVAFGRFMASLSKYFGPHFDCSKEARELQQLCNAHKLWMKSSEYTSLRTEFEKDPKKAQGAIADWSKEDPWMWEDFQATKTLYAQTVEEYNREMRKPTPETARVTRLLGEIGNALSALTNQLLTQLRLVSALRSPTFEQFMAQFFKYSDPRFDCGKGAWELQLCHEHKPWMKSLEVGLLKTEFEKDPKKAEQFQDRWLKEDPKTWGEFQATKAKYKQRVEEYKREMQKIPPDGQVNDPRLKARALRID
jgi:hypothetical protein